jgi:hypothetical protein
VGDTTGRGKLGFGSGTLVAGDGCGTSVSGVEVGSGIGVSSVAGRWFVFELPAGDCSGEAPALSFEF